MINRYPGKCAKCATRVPAGAGEFTRGAVFCRTCARSAGAPSAAAAPSASPSATPTLSAGGALVTTGFPGNDALTIIRGAPGARWNPDAKHWTWSVDDADLPRTIECASKIGAVVAPELLARLDAGTAETRAAGARIAEIEARSGCKLYPFQLAGVDHLARRPRAMLADDMGLGKTIQALAALPAGARCVVVCPSSLKLNWRREAAKWRPELTVSVLSGRKGFRLPGDGEIVIVNYEILPSDEIDMAGVTLIVDEAHRCKNYRAARSKRIASLGRTARAVWFLTGTPLMTRPSDLYGIFGALGGPNPLGSWQTFVKLFNGSQDKWGGWTWGEPRADVPERIRRVALRRTKAEVLPDLPRKVRTTIEVNDLPRDLARDCDRAMSDWDSGDRAELPSFDMFSELRARLALARVPALLDMIEDHEGSDDGAPLLVFSAHRAPILALADREGWRVITGSTPINERDEIVAQYQAGKLRGIGLTIAAGGVGLTLTRGSRAIFVDQDWTPALNMQAEDRMVRIGQSAASVQIDVLVSAHPLDKHVADLLAQKIAMIEAAVEREAPAATCATPVDRDRAIRMAIKREAEATVARRATGEILSSAAPHPETDPARLAIMLSRVADSCDGAEERDGVGFSKRDVALGHSIVTLLGMDPTEETIDAARRLSTVYRKQIDGGGE